MKIRTRLTLQFILITACIFTLVLLFIFRQFQQYTENEFFSHLENKARMTAEMVLRHESDIKPIEKVPSDNRIKLPSIGNTSIYNDHLQCVFTLNTSADAVSNSHLKHIEPNSSYRFTQDNFQAVGISLTSHSGKRYIVVAEDIPDFSKLLTLRNILLLSFLLALAAVATGGWFYAGQALQPVLNIVNEVDNILPIDLSRRLKKDNNHDEISHLVTTFNSLLDRIQHAFQMQRGFISNVSHELKNPIATMDAQLQLARNKTRSVEEYDRVLASLHEDVKEITDTADKLLQLAKIHSGSTQIEFSNVRLDELIYQSRDTLLKTHPNYHITIDIRQLPENEEDLCINGNEFLLRSALINLFDNSCKFSDDQKAHIIIDFSAKNQLEIRDKGQGISAKDLPYIFEPFFRGHQNGHKKGSGIGLSLVQSILQLHHISIEVQSSLEHGTSFLLSFPVEKWVNIADSQTPSFNTIPIKQKTKLAFKHVEKALKLFSFIALTSIAHIKCSNTEKADPPQYKQGFEVIQDWNSLLLDLVQYSNGYRPPVSARMYAYMGLAAWEVSLPALNNAQSVAPLFKDLTLPIWTNEKPFIAPIALNAAYAALTKYFFPHTPYAMQQKQAVLKEKWEKSLSKNYPQEAIEASKIYGVSVAEAVFQWSATDSVGHQAFLYNYDSNYKSSTDKGAWQAQGITAMPALLPHWGNARTFVMPINALLVTDPTPFSEAQNMPFFAQAMEVYSTSKPMTEEKRWIAEFWSDDYPNISFCAASRWIAITHQALQAYKTDFSTALETYLKVGFALNDAAVKVWYEKYKFNLLRPEIYIQHHIDPLWKPLHDTPSFPSYPSGHSAFGGAAAVVLSNILGENRSLTDRSHEDCTVFIGRPRTFTSFKAIAEENALSRLFIGVHYRMDCEEGLRLGYLIGENMSSLKVRKLYKLVEK
jgi:signal transduction histidine kinase/membrane-associated phospholipid phosphatase